MKEFSKKYTYSGCPFRSVMNRFGDKWSIQIIITIGENKVMRFNELEKAIDDISQKMLTVSLRNLEEDGLVARTVFPVVPPRVEYELTEMGKSLLPVINNLAEWTLANTSNTAIKIEKT